MATFPWQFLRGLAGVCCVAGLAAPSAAQSLGDATSTLAAQQAVSHATPAVTVAPAVLVLGPVTAGAGSKGMAAVAPASRSAAFDGRVVALQPFGVVDAALLLATANVLHRNYQLDVKVLPPRPLPRSAFFPARRRYRGERLIQDLEARTPSVFAKVLGITGSDVSVTKGSIFDWGVLGVSGLAGRAAVVSTWRMRRGAPAELVRKRLEQVATHELGHTFGLPHCATPGCIMNDACGTVRVVDASSGSFCPRCRRRLEAAMRNAGASPGGGAPATPGSG